MASNIGMMVRQNIYLATLQCTDFVIQIFFCHLTPWLQGSSRDALLIDAAFSCAPTAEMGWGAVQMQRSSFSIRHECKKHLYLALSRPNFAALRLICINSGRHQYVRLLGTKNKLRRYADNGVYMFFAAATCSVWTAPFPRKVFTLMQAVSQCIRRISKRCT